MRIKRVPYIKRALIKRALFKRAPYIKRARTYNKSTYLRSTLKVHLRYKKCTLYIKSAHYVMKIAPYVMKSTYHVKINQQLWQLWCSINIC